VPQGAKLLFKLKMVSIYDVDPTELIKKAAEKLKENENIKPPVWADFVKTGRHKERPPAEKGWWYIRAAAVLRSVYKLGPIGVSKLRSKYGGVERRGMQPEHFFKGSGSIIRKVLQQLEKAGYIQKVEKGVKKGRIITPKGKSLLDKTAVIVSGKQLSPTKLERKKKEKKVEEIEEDADEEKPTVKKEEKPKKKRGRPKKGKDAPAVNEPAGETKNLAAGKKEPAAEELVEETEDNAPEEQNG